jgi:hypothetical protein
VEKIGRANHVKNEVLHRVKEESNFLHTIKRTDNWIGDLCRNCYLKHVIEGKIEDKRRREGRSEQLLDDIKERRECWKLKEKAPECTLNSLSKRMWTCRKTVYEMKEQAAVVYSTSFRLVNSNTV